MVTSGRSQTNLPDVCTPWGSDANRRAFVRFFTRLEREFVIMLRAMSLLGLHGLDERHGQGRLQPR